MRSRTHSSYCVDDTTIGSCTEGSYNTTQCVGDETCVAAGETASCVAPEPEEDTDVTEPEEEDTDVTEPEEEDPTEEEAPEGSVRPDAPTPPTLGCNVSPSTTWPAWAMVLWSLAAIWRQRDPVRVANGPTEMATESKPVATDLLADTQ